MDGMKNCISVDLGNNKVCLIPIDLNNLQYQEIMEWVNQGNVIEDNLPA